MPNFPKNAPSIRNPKKPTSKTNVKYYPGLGYAPTIKEASLKGQRKGCNV